MLLIRYPKLSNPHLISSTSCSFPDERMQGSQNSSYSVPSSLEPVDEGIVGQSIPDLHLRDTSGDDFLGTYFGAFILFLSTLHLFYLLCGLCIKKSKVKLQLSVQLSTSALREMSQLQARHGDHDVPLHFCFS